MQISIRPSQEADLPFIHSIDQAGTEPFVQIGLHIVAHEDIFKVSSEELKDCHLQGHIWVAVPADNTNQQSLAEQAATAGQHEQEHELKQQQEGEVNDGKPKYMPPIAFIMVHVIRNDNIAGGKSVVLQEVTVLPVYARQGIGRRLIEHVENWMRRSGLRVLDLTTFDDIPWNAPYYRRLGFHTVDLEQLLLPEYTSLRLILMCDKYDKVQGRWPRVAMRKVLADP